MDSWKFFAFEDSPNTNDVFRFYEFLWSSVETNFKQKGRKHTANPFFYSSLTMHTLKKLNTMRRKIARNPSKTNLSRFSELEIEFLEFSEMDKICFINGSMTSNFSDCFALLRSLKSSDYPKITFFDQERLENPVDVANGLNKFFAKNFNTGSFTGVAYSSSEFIGLKDFKFSIRPDLILIEIMRIKLSTYPTNDYFPCQLLKTVPQMFADLLAYIFYSITDCKIFPAIWKIAFIRPLHKSLFKASIENYRPISLLSKISLVFERLLFVYLFGLCKAQLHPKQFDFQSRKNPVLQLIEYLETLYRNKSSTLSTVYLDYAKAFDKVPHKILLSKLKLFGFDSELLLLFETYLIGRTQVVNVNGCFPNICQYLVESLKGQS